MAEQLWETNDGKRPPDTTTNPAPQPKGNKPVVSGDHPFSGPERTRQIKDRKKTMKDIMDDLDNS